MKVSLRHFLLVAAVFASVTAASLTASAQSQRDSVLRPVLSAYTLEAGSARVADTYLSPLHHSGFHVGIGYERMQAMRFSPEKWVMQLRGRLSVEKTMNIPARNASIWDIGFDVSWAMTRRFRAGAGWSFLAGGRTSLDLGALYSTRNSNNPVSAKASWTVGLTGSAIYNVRLGRLPVCFRYEASLPLTGVFFSPDYGELYYEIYLGNRSGLAHAAWPGNFFRFDSSLTADLRFGATVLRVGYSGRLFSSRSSDLTTRMSSHCFVLGVATEWFSIGTRGLSRDDRRIISSLY